MADRAQTEESGFPPRLNIPSPASQSVPNQPPPSPPRALYPDYSAEDAAGAPWKYTGYRVFARWMAAEQELFIVRRFGALNTRVILALQDEITQFEQRLDMIDMEYSRKARDLSTNNGSFRSDQSEERRELIQDILPSKLLKYNKFVNEYSKLGTRAAVDPLDVKKVKRWFDHDHPYAIEELERAFIARKDDLIPVLPKVKPRYRHFLEPILRHPIFRRHFVRKPDDIELIDDDMTIWYSEKKDERLFSIIVAVGGLYVFIVPMWLLESISVSDREALIMTSLISLFFILVAFATTAKIFEALAAAAAYATVLLVCVQTGHHG